MNANIILLPGDGVGPEVVQAAQKVLHRVAEIYGHAFKYETRLIGGKAINIEGAALSDDTVACCLEADAILLGAVGGPEWDNPSAAVRPEQGLLRLRKALGLFANLRPVTVHPALINASPLKAERLAGVDFIVVRELTGGLYFGKQSRDETPEGLRATDTLEYHDYEIRRVVELACKIAMTRRNHVTSVDKANVLESSRLWREVANDVAQKHPGITMHHQLVDSAAMRLITHASTFDVLVTENMFGDILTDEASVLSGSLGLLASASLGETTLGVYEPIHGSAPDIAGQGVANPLGTIMSAALMLRHSLGLPAEAEAIESAVFNSIAEGARSPDLGGTLGTVAMTEAVLAQLS